MSIAYQRIVLQSTFELANDYKIFERERTVAGNILNENGIDYAALIQEDHGIGPKGRAIPAEYILSIFVKMADVDKVIELFDQDGTLGYYVDLDFKIVADGPLTEEIIRDADEEYSKIEFENNMSNENYEEVNPIESFDDKLEDEDLEEDESGEIKLSLVQLCYYVFLFIMFLIIILVEIGIIFKVIEDENYGAIIPVIIAIICEIPIMIGFLKQINKKKGK